MNGTGYLARNKIAAIAWCVLSNGDCNTMVEARFVKPAVASSILVSHPIFTGISCHIHGKPPCE